MLLILLQALDYRLAPLWLMWTEMKIGSPSVHPYAGKEIIEHALSPTPNHSTAQDLRLKGLFWVYFELFY
jgi:hypothetical protein